MKAILMSIRPEWVAKILNGEKTIEIRKTMPKCELPIDVYIWCTKGKPLIRLSNVFGEVVKYDVDLERNRSEYTKTFDGKVVAKFTLKEIEQITQRKICGEWEVYGEHTDFIELDRMSCLEQDEIMDYMGGNYHAYAWYISGLVIFDKPMELSEFSVVDRIIDVIDENGNPDKYKILKKLTKAPQSWQYIRKE